jgi:hypothetical protein
VRNEAGVWLKIFSRGPALRVAIAVACACSVLTTLAGAQEQPKKAVQSANDLPRFTYPLDGPASALFSSDAATFNAFGMKVRANIESTLAGYDIQDRGTVRGLLEQKLELQVLAGNEDAGALATAQQIRALEDKPDQKLLSGVEVAAVVAARAQTGMAAGDAYLASFRQHYAAALAPLPWAVVGRTLKETKTTYETLTPALLLGAIVANLDPGVAKTHAIDSDAAMMLIRYRFYNDVVLPLRAPGTAVIATLIDTYDKPKPDIWAARDVTLHASDKLTPVRVAIWDSGSDVALFPHQLFTDPSPGPDDPHGLAFDLLGFKAHGYLDSLTPAQRQVLPAALTFLEGYSDLQESIDSPAAATAKKEFASLAPADVPALLANLQLAGFYAHGTHVAGIALRGNPAARLVVGRITFDYKLIPTPPTQELERRSAADYQAYVDYFRAHHVRVVNMSWAGTPANDEAALEKNNIGKDATERKALAQKLFAIDRAGLYAAIKSAPEIVFVCAAGNAGGDAGFSDEIPAGFELPNLIAVGAVDQAGDETSFTSYGKTVLVDADGYHVESYVPGGGTLRLSGTSQAAPNVTNLAAKLIALDPHLTPRETIDLIRRGATPSSDGRRHNIDPKRSVQLLEKEEAAR